MINPKLFDQMKNTSKRLIPGKQLACISQLVFYSGIRKKEVPILKICDVVDTGCNIKKSISVSVFKKNIILNSIMMEEMRSYIDDLKNLTSSPTNQSDWLFPNYRNEKKLWRHWKEFNIKYIDIFHAGIKDYWANGRTSGILKNTIIADGSKQLRITEREFKAIVYGQKIPAGKTIDHHCSMRILELLEEAEKIKKSEPDSKQKATNILNQFNESLKKFKSQNMRKSYEQVRPKFNSLLDPFLKS